MYVFRECLKEWAKAFLATEFSEKKLKSSVASPQD